MKILHFGIIELQELKHWDKNPRRWTPENLEDLKAQITELGNYKPIVITEDGTVIGGNMRLDALHDLGEKFAWVSMVEAKTHSDKLFIALADNDMVGHTDTDKLMPLLADSVPDDFKHYTVDFDFGQRISELQEMAQLPPDGGSDRLSNIEKMILPFTSKEYAEIMPILERTMEKLSFDNHTQVIIHLAEQYAKDV